MTTPVMALVLAMEDFLNKPPRIWAIEPMEVREYRAAAYRVWEPLCRALIADLKAKEPPNVR